MRVFILVLSLTCAALLVFGFVPSDDPVLDTVSFFRPAFVAGTATGLGVTRGWVRVAGLSVVLAALASIWASLPPQVPGGDLRLYAKNIRFDNGAIEPLRRDILAQLRPDFPYQAVCGEGSLFAMAVVSKPPFSDAPRCSQTRGLAAAQVGLAGGPVWIVSVHWPWPWPAGGRSSDDQMRAVLAGLDGAVVLAGDFNTLPWAHRLTGAKRLTRTKRAGPTPLTLWHRKLLIPLPLDYVLAPGGGRVKVRPLFGSDHMGLVANLTVLGP